MDFSAYPNIEKVLNSKVKETKLNKKMYAKMEERLSKITPEEFQKIDSEIVSAKKVYDLLITPTAVINIDKVWHTVDIILHRDIVYIWGATTKMTMMFIPYQKITVVNILSRNGDGITTEQISTGGFSKKDVTGQVINELRAVIEPQYPGVLYGWTKEREDAMWNDFQALVNAVDEARK